MCIRDSAREAKWDGVKLVPHGPVVSIENTVSEAYARQGMVVPITEPLQIKRAKEHYFPLRYKFNVKIGADHSWINT